MWSEKFILNQETLPQLLKDLMNLLRRSLPSAIKRMSILSSVHFSKWYPLAIACPRRMILLRELEAGGLPAPPKNMEGTSPQERESYP